MSERPTVRPVTLSRLVELTHLAENAPVTTPTIEKRLEVSRARARETVLEASRLSVVHEETQSATPDGDDGEEASRTDDSADSVAITPTGEEFLAAVRNEDWSHLSSILRDQSPHYDAYLTALETVDTSLSVETILQDLERATAESPIAFNQTGIEVVGDWAERLGAVQRNAFTGDVYRVATAEIPDDFPSVLLSVIDDREQEAGVNLRQRYLSIPELREFTCQRLRCPRVAFDEAVVTLATQNVGAVELSGAPLDTGAKEAALGIKQIGLTDGDGLVSTEQSTDRVMAGVEQHGKRYYFLAVHDRDITFTH